MRHPVFLWGVVFLLAAGSWWLGNRERPPEPRQPDQQAPREADYYLRKLKATTMDRSGRPARTLAASELRHFPDDDTTELASPRLIIYQPDGPPWLIVSDTGWVSSDASLILLNGEVHITHEKGKNNRPIRLDTRNLRVQPQENYAETDEKVRVRSLLDRIDATGMQAWLGPPARIKLLANAKGHYAPPR